MIEGFLFHWVNVEGARLPPDGQVQFSIIVITDTADPRFSFSNGTIMRTTSALNAPGGLAWSVENTLTLHFLPRSRSVRGCLRTHLGF